MSEPETAPMRIEVVRGGEPTPQQMAAIVVVVQQLFTGGGGAAASGTAGSGVPAATEWALGGRLGGLGWEPLWQRWPGEPAGRSWRRAI